MRPDRQAQSTPRDRPDHTGACDTLRKVIIEAQPDWITASYRGSRRILDGQTLAEGLQAEELDLGGLPSEFRFLGVPMRRVGRVAFGADRDVGWLQLSGQVASDGLEVVSRTCSKVTRIDVATTVQLQRLDDELGRRAYGAACLWAEGRARAPRISFTENSDRGATLNIGDRESERYFRLYNKQRESEVHNDQAGIEHYQRCWRAELELKKSVAEPTARRICEAPDPAALCQAMIAEYLHAHGIVDLVAFDGQRVLVPGFKRRADVDSRLRWLQTHVRPIVVRLVDYGYSADVFEALQLTGAREDG